MKKFVAIIMAILVMASLCACGNTNKSIEGTYTLDTEASHVGNFFDRNMVSCESSISISDVNSDGIGTIRCRASYVYTRDEIACEDVENAYGAAMDMLDKANNISSSEDFNLDDYMDAMDDLKDIYDSSINTKTVEKNSEGIVFNGTYRFNDDGNIVVTPDKDSDLYWQVDEDVYSSFVIVIGDDGSLSFEFKDYGDIYEFVYNKDA